MKPDPHLRLALLAVHRRVLFLGPQRNFFIMLAVLLALVAAVEGATVYFLSTTTAGWVAISVFIILSGTLHKNYFIDLPADKNILTFFESKHPELCSWLPESALLEAKMLFEPNGL